LAHAPRSPEAVARAARAAGMTVVAATLAALALPLALGGEASTETGPGTTAIAVISVLSMLGGYVLLWALWHYVFSAKARERRRDSED
jgi:hypothetical protein